MIDEAMRAIEAENKNLKNVLPKNYASLNLDKRVLGDVVDFFTNMDMGKTDDNKDLLGRTYEYCIAQFAAYEGVKGGEFYTPSSIVRTIVEILKPFDNCRVYDPCCGGTGDDLLQGQNGNDTYIFGENHGNDKIFVYSNNSVEVDKAIFADEALHLIFSKQGNDMIISHATSKDKVKVQNWNYGTSYQLDEIISKDNKKINAANIDLLIQAMAAYTQEHGMTWNQAIQERRDDVQNIYNQFWTNN